MEMPEMDERWLELHRSSGQVPLLEMRRAFRKSGAELMTAREASLFGWAVPSDGWGRVFREYAYANHGNVAISQWARFRDAAEKSGYMPVWEYTQTADTTAPVLLWREADGWEGSDIPAPAYAHPGDAGLDAVCMERVELPGPGRVVDVPLAISVAPPPGFWYMVVGRSSAINRGIRVHLGVIDEGYRGPLFARCEAISDPVVVEHGQRVAQLILMPLVRADVRYSPDPLPESVRGNGGFGSTGGH